MEGNVPPPDPGAAEIAEGIGAGAVGGGVEKDLHPREAHLQDLQIPPQQREQGHLDGDLFGRGEVVIAVTFRVGVFMSPMTRRGVSERSRRIGPPS